MISRIIIVFLSLSLGACGTANVKKDFSVDSLVNTSVVVGSITQKRSLEGHQGFSSAISALSVIYTNKETGESARIDSDPWSLGSLSKGDFKHIPGRGRLFAIELSPGSYAFKGWSAMQGSYTTVTPTQPQEFVFNVEPGKVIYIGELEFQLIFGKNIFGVGILVDATQSVVDSYDRDIKVLSEKYPQIDINQISKQLMTDTAELSGGGVNREAQTIPPLGTPINP